MQRAADLFKKLISVVLSAVFSFVMLSGLLADTVSAASIQSFNISCQADSQSARDMLASINEWRTSGTAWYWNKENTKKIQCGSLSALKYDYKLEKIAQQRAYEVAVKFSHTRPNNQDWYTCTAGGTQTNAENIAAGQTTAAAVFKSWQEENAKYSGQGHRRNMLGSYTSIGIAHVVYQGVHYWVQEFSITNSGAGATDALSGTVTGTVDICLSEFKLTLNTLPEINVEMGSVNSFPVISGYLKASDTWGNNGVLVTSKELPATWTSSNTSIVTVEGSAFKAVGYGNSKLTATISCGGKNYSTSTTVSVLNPGVTGWQTDENGKKRYFDEMGKMLTGWRTIGGSKYYFDPATGVATTGVRKISGKYYLFAKSGVMQKNGWKKDGKGNTYYLRKNGAAYTKKWSKKKRKWYYFGANGKMVKGKTLKIGKKRYKFKSNGVCKNKR